MQLVMQIIHKYITIFSFRMSGDPLKPENTGIIWKYKTCQKLENSSLVTNTDQFLKACTNHTSFPTKMALKPQIWHSLYL